MPSYIISYDLNHHTPEDYEKVREELRLIISELGVSRRYLTTTYLLNSPCTLFQIENILCKRLKGPDRMLICEINTPVAGWLSTEEIQWAKSNL